MAIIKQATGYQRQWFDYLPHLVCIAAVLTLTSAAATGIFSQRLGTLATAQKDHQTRSDQNATEALGQAKAQWEKKKVELEKALLSAKLKIKAEQTTSASIRKRLVTVQKELEGLKKIAGGQAVKPAAPAPPAVPAPPAAAPAATPETAAPKPPATVTEAPAPVSNEAPAVPVSPAPKPSEPPSAPAVKPVELAPPAGVEEAPGEVPTQKETVSGETPPSTSE